MSWRIIYDPNCAYGGHSCHATSDGKMVHIKHCNQNKYSTFKIIAKLTMKEWDYFVEKTDLYNPYRRDPRVLFYNFYESRYWEPGGSIKSFFVENKDWWED